MSSLQLAEGTKLVVAELSRDKHNMMPVLLANYADFYQLFFNEDPDFYKRSMPTMEVRYNLLEASPDTCSYKLHSLGVICFQRALVHAKFGNNVQAARQISKARDFFLANKKRFPQMHDGDMYLGVINAVIGTIPDGYKWIAKLLGFSGNVQQGVAQQIQALKYKHAGNDADLILLYAYSKQYIENKPEEAWTFLKSLIPQAKNNRLYTFLLANIALNQNNAKSALEILDANMDRAGFMEFPFLHYEKGAAQMYALDQKAIGSFALFVKQYKGKFYKKDACYKMCMLSYLQGNAANADFYRKQIQTVGHTEAEADKVAQAFSKEPKYPNKVLLASRLLSDGGHYQRAANKLAEINATALSGDELIEYYYRSARIQDLQKNATKALEQYDVCIQKGQTSKTYFAAKACVQSGMIYEQQGNKAAAIKMYQKCLGLGDHQYKNSIGQVAKAGLARLGKSS
ncbi:MAG: hypothetical protein RL660_1592 [Bacteroidota bacterium]|jgi:hypothetical protein